jgi:hypothetical protein
MSRTLEGKKDELRIMDWEGEYGDLGRQRIGGNLLALDFFANRSNDANTPMASQPPETPSLSPFLIRTDQVQAGDILLTRGSEKKSKVIARFSSGQFSHSALCINPHMIFESDGGFIGQKVFETIGTAEIGGVTASVSEIPGEPADAAVYRHPLMARVPEERFREVLFAEMSESYGKDYSEMSRLVALAQTPRAVKMLLETYYHLEHKVRYSENVPGPFCSELVARIYSRLGLPLFPSDKSPDQVSPNDLASSSNLVKVEDAIVPSACLSIQPPMVKVSDFWLGSKAYQPLEGDSRQPGQDPFAAYANWQKRTGKLLEQLTPNTGALHKITEELLELIIRTFQRSIPMVMDDLNAAFTWNHPGVLRRAVVLAKRCTSLGERVPNLVSGFMARDARTVLPVVRNLKSFERSAVRCHVLLRMRQRALERPSYSWWQRCRSDRNALRIARTVRRQMQDFRSSEEWILDSLADYLQFARSSDGQGPGQKVGATEGPD